MSSSAYLDYAGLKVFKAAEDALIKKLDAEILRRDAVKIVKESTPTEGSVATYTITQDEKYEENASVKYTFTGKTFTAVLTAAEKATVDSGTPVSTSSSITVTKVSGGYTLTDGVTTETVTAPVKSATTITYDAYQVLVEAYKADQKSATPTLPDPATLYTAVAIEIGKIEVPLDKYVESGEVAVRPKSYILVKADDTEVAMTLAEHNTAVTTGTVTLTGGQVVTYSAGVWAVDGSTSTLKAVNGTYIDLTMANEFEADGSNKKVVIDVSSLGGDIADLQERMTKAENAIGKDADGNLVAVTDRIKDEAVDATYTTKTVYVGKEGTSVAGTTISEDAWKALPAASQADYEAKTVTDETIKDALERFEEDLTFKKTVTDRTEYAAIVASEGDLYYFDMPETYDEIANPTNIITKAAYEALTKAQQALYELHDTAIIGWKFWSTKDVAAGEWKELSDATLTERVAKLETQVGKNKDVNVYEKKTDLVDIVNLLTADKTNTGSVDEKIYNDAADAVNDKDFFDKISGTDATTSVELSVLLTSAEKTELDKGTATDPVTITKGAITVTFDGTGYALSDGTNNATGAASKADRSIKRAIEDVSNAATVDVEKLDTAEDGYIASYIVKQNGTQVGSTINIPKDFLVKSANKIKYVKITTLTGATLGAVDLTAAQLARVDAGGEEVIGTITVKKNGSDYELTDGTTTEVATVTENIYEDVADPTHKTPITTVPTGVTLEKLYIDFVVNVKDSKIDHYQLITDHTKTITVAAYNKLSAADKALYEAVYVEDEHIYLDVTDLVEDFTTESAADAATNKHEVVLTLSDDRELSAVIRDASVTRKKIDADFEEDVADIENAIGWVNKKDKYGYDVKDASGNVIKELKSVTDRIKDEAELATYTRDKVASYTIENGTVKLALTIAQAAGLADQSATPITVADLDGNNHTVAFDGTDYTIDSVTVAAPVVVDETTTIQAALRALEKASSDTNGAFVYKGRLTSTTVTSTQNDKLYALGDASSADADAKCVVANRVTEYKNKTDASVITTAAYDALSDTDKANYEECTWSTATFEKIDPAASLPKTGAVGDYYVVDGMSYVCTVASVGTEGDPGFTSATYIKLAIDDTFLNTVLGNGFAVAGLDATVKKYIDSRIFIGSQANYDRAIAAKEIDSTCLSIITDDDAESLTPIKKADIEALFED